jgi:hypothetical protein
MDGSSQAASQSAAVEAVFLVAIGASLGRTTDLLHRWNGRTKNRHPGYRARLMQTWSGAN